MYYNRFLGCSTPCCGNLDGSSIALTGCTVNISNLTISNVETLNGGGGGSADNSGVVTGDFSAIEDGGAGIVSGSDTASKAIERLDGWMFHNLVDMPPAVGLSLFGQTGTSVTVRWTPPTVYELGMIDKTVPFIDGLVFSVYRATQEEVSWGSLFPSATFGVTADSDKIELSSAVQSLPNGSTIDVKYFLSAGTLDYSGTSVTGSGTYFNDELSEGVELLMPDGQKRTVTAVASQTSLTVGEPWSTSASGQSATSVVVLQSRVLISGAGSAALTVDRAFDAAVTNAHQQAAVTLYALSRTFDDITDLQYLPSETTSSPVDAITLYMEGKTHDAASATAAHAPGDSGGALVNFDFIDTGISHTDRLQVHMYYKNHNSRRQNYTVLDNLTFLDVGPPGAPVSLSAASDPAAATSLVAVWSPNADHNSALTGSQSTPLMRDYTLTAASSALAPNLYRHDGGSAFNHFVTVNTITQVVTHDHAASPQSFTFAGVQAGQTYTVTATARNTIDTGSSSQTALTAYTDPPATLDPLDTLEWTFNSALPTFSPTWIDSPPSGHDGVTPPIRSLTSSSLISLPVFSLTSGKFKLAEVLIPINDAATYDPAATTHTLAARVTSFDESGAQTDDQAATSSAFPHFPVSNSYPVVPASSTSATQIEFERLSHADVHSGDSTQDGFFAQIVVCVWLYVSHFLDSRDKRSVRIERETNGALVQGLSKELFGDVLSDPPTVVKFRLGVDTQLFNMKSDAHSGGYQYSNTVLCGVGSYGDGLSFNTLVAVKKLGRHFLRQDRLLTTSLTLGSPDSVNAVTVGTVSFSGSDNTVSLSPNGDATNLQNGFAFPVTVNNSQAFRRIQTVAPDSQTAETDSWIENYDAELGVYIPDVVFQLDDTTADGIWTHSDDTFLFLSVTAHSIVGDSELFDASWIDLPSSAQKLEFFIAGARKDFTVSSLRHIFVDTMSQRYLTPYYQPDKHSLGSIAPSQDSEGRYTLMGARVVLARQKEFVSFGQTAYSGADFESFHIQVHHRFDIQTYDHERLLVAEATAPLVGSEDEEVSTNLNASKVSTAIGYMQTLVGYSYINEHNITTTADVDEHFGFYDTNDYFTRYQQELQFVGGQLRTANSSQDAAYIDYNYDFIPVPVASDGNHDGVSFSKYRPMPDYTTITRDEGYRTACYMFDLHEISSLVKRINHIDILFKDGSSLAQLPSADQGITQGIHVFAKLLTGVANKKDTYVVQSPDNVRHATRWISCNEPLSLSADVSQTYYEPLDTPVPGMQHPSDNGGITTNNVKRMLLPSNTPTLSLRVLIYVAAHNSYDIHFGHVELRVG